LRPTLKSSSRWRIRPTALANLAAARLKGKDFPSGKGRKGPGGPHVIFPFGNTVRFPPLQKHGESTGQIRVA
jgi:hypothetical protein